MKPRRRGGYTSYLRLVGDLLYKRATQGTTEDEEESFGIKLDDLWQQMSEDEHQRVETTIGRYRGEQRPAARFAARELEAKLRALGIASSVQVERIGKTRLYRIVVVSDDFEPLRHTERQNLVWRIVREGLTPQQLQRITMIYTATASELGDKESAPRSFGERAAKAVREFVRTHPEKLVALAHEASPPELFPSKKGKGPMSTRPRTRFFLQRPDGTEQQLVSRVRSTGPEGTDYFLSVDETAHNAPRKLRRRKKS